MKKMMKLLGIVIMLASTILIWHAMPESCVYAAGRSNAPISPAEYQRMLGKGMDVDWSKSNKGKRNYSNTAVRNMKKAGISHVRIRVKESVSEKMFQTQDQQINDCIKNGVIPVLAYQANKFKNTVS